MNREKLREALAQAGSKFDGHVTNGSLDEQMKVIESVAKDFETAVYKWRAQLLDAWANEYKATMTVLIEMGPVDGL
jgi:hypothetical protein